MESAILCLILPKMVLFLISVRCVLITNILHLSPHSGPKMYIANGNLQNNLYHGSTRLHLDVTGAINIMLYGAHLPDGKSGGALWHIFPSSAIPILRDFCRTEPSAGFQEPGDPIHNQAIYLTPTLLQLLSEKFGVHPFVIYQHPGDAVFIPAGCPHQVSIKCRFWIART
jgi:hypothetical protein